MVMFGLTPLTVVQPQHAQALLYDALFSIM
jgi:hypothetical protein